MAEYKPLQDIAYDYLRDMIYSRMLSFDQIYSETGMAKQLEISRTPMREALTRLNRERYIDIIPNRGFQLHKPTEADVNEAFHIRIGRFHSPLLISGVCNSHKIFKHGFYGEALLCIIAYACLRVFSLAYLTLCPGFIIQLHDRSNVSVFGHLEAAYLK